MAEFWGWVEKYGFSSVVLVVFAVAAWRFFIHHLWPTMIAQNETAQKRLEAQTSAFLKTLEEEREACKIEFDQLSKLMAERFNRTDDKINGLRQ